MKTRVSRISDSILAAVSTRDEQDPAKGTAARRRKIIRVVLAFFSFFKLLLSRYRAADFRALRKDVWKLDEDEYDRAFGHDASELDGSSGSQRRRDKAKDAELKPVGDLGYSGSTFFTTADSKYLIKSLPRRFEHEFFTHDLFEPYVAHMKSRPRSLLVRITDMVYTPYPTLGGVLGLAPTHHIIMENLLYGKGAEQGGGGGGDDTEWQGMKWETYDLKPNDYFFPERDIADGKLAPQSVKDKLIDEFPDRVRVGARDKQRLLDILGADTQLLADNNAIDYSLFLVRYPGPNASSGDGDDDVNIQAGSGNPGNRPQVPKLKSDAGPWREGLDDRSGRWTYRLVVLDFFWARHKFRAQAMTGLVKLFNKVAHKGPMSITANPKEYRERFLKMVDEIVVVEGSASS